MKKLFTVILTLCFTVLILITCKKKPEVEIYTLTITNEDITVTTTSATIKADFSFPTTIYDIKVVLSDNSGMTNAIIKPTTISGNMLTVTFDDLTMNTMYYYCYRYSNNVNIVDTEAKHFTTQDASQPTVTTGEVTDITKITAKAYGNVTNDGEATVTERGVCWSENHNPTIDGSHANNGTGTGEYNVSITGLTAGTTYYVRAYAKNRVGTSYGSEVSFTTLPNDNAPTVTTGEVTDITKTTAEGHGNVTNDGGATVTERGVCWGETHNPTIDGSHANNGTGTGEYNVSITGLTAGTTYYVRAYAKNSEGTSYGSEVIFTTLPNDNAPTVTTGEVTNITKTSAKGHGNVTNDGGATVTDRGVCWSETPNPTINDNHANEGTGTGEYTVNITGLTKGTTYYVRAYATNSEGTSYGSEVSFTTKADKPTVTTSDVTNISENAAIGGGVVTDDGGAEVTARGICLSTSANPTISNTHTTNGTGIGSFVSALSGLAHNTTYYVRAYATNSAGTSYGEQKSFTTVNAGWLSYCENTSIGAMGFISGGTYTWAVMFPSNILTQYAGTRLTKVKFYTRSDGLGTFTIKIHRGGTSAPMDLIYYQGVDVTSSGWQEVDIQPVDIETSQPLWVVLTINQQPDQYPACKSAGVNDPNARWGCWAGEWKDFGSEEDFSWMIRAYVTSSTKGEEGREFELK